MNDQGWPPPDQSRPLGLAVVGAGRFGEFSVRQYLGLDELRPVALFDPDPARATAAAQALGFEVATSLEGLLSRSEVDVVYVASPPSTHAEVALHALRAGKHVLCEKPLATDEDAARALVGTADQRGLVLAANLIMRYNPVCQAVHRILADGLLGEPLHAFFENYADDEVLPPGHWFWDKAVSGGIFVEHGVHFFDLFALWFGDGRVLSAGQGLRPGSAVVEQVTCSAVFGDQVLASFYHGFHQPSRMDRQEIRIVCERGSIRLFEWMPVSVEIDCIADRAALDALTRVVDAEVEVVASYEGIGRQVSSRHKSYEVDGRYLLRTRSPLPKMQLYADAVRDLMSDQLSAVHDPTHRRLVTAQNGLASLQMAVRAETLATRGEPAEG